MTLKEKREIIVKNKDPAIAALDSVLDRIYDLSDVTLDKKSDNVGNANIQQLVEELKKDASKYEKVRRKLLYGDIDLSLTEINYIALAFHFCAERMRGEVISLNKAIGISESMVKKLMSAESKESKD